MGSTLRQALVSKIPTQEDSKMGPRVWALRAVKVVVRNGAVLQELEESYTKEQGTEQHGPKCFEFLPSV